MEKKKKPESNTSLIRRLKQDPAFQAYAKVCAESSVAQKSEKNPKRKKTEHLDECEECGEMVTYIIGCPDGAEICQECFDAGLH